MEKAKALLGVNWLESEKPGTVNFSMKMLGRLTENKDELAQREGKSRM